MHEVLVGFGQLEGYHEKCSNSLMCKTHEQKEVVQTAKLCKIIIV